MRLLLLAAAVSVAVLATETLQAQNVSSEPRPWSFSLGVKEDYQTRARLSVASDKPDLISRVGGILHYSHSSPRFQLLFNGSGAGMFWKEEHSLNRFTYAGTVAGNYIASQRLTFSFADALTSAYTYEHTALVENGLFLPQVQSLTNRATAGLDYQLSGRTTLSFNVRNDLVKFNAPGLIPGSRFSADTQLKRQVSQRSSFGIVYSFNRHDNRDRITLVNAVLASWNGTLSARLDADAAIGLGLLHDSLEPSDHALPVAAAGLRAHFQHTTFAARYHRSVSPAYGFGRDRLTDSLDLDFNRTLGEKFGFLVISTLGTNDDPFHPGVRAYSQNNYVNLKYTMSPDFALVAGYSYRKRRVEGSNSDVHSHGAQISANYGFRW
jgi:hypothetical protein